MRPRVYYFLGNTVDHVLHALPLHKVLQGTFIVLSEKAKRQLEDIYGLTDVVCIQNKPRVQLELNKSVDKTIKFLNAEADIVIFYELFGFTGNSTLSEPMKVFLTHGNMLKDYMTSHPMRLTWLKEYDYMAALGPFMKNKFVAAHGIPSKKLLDIGIARTDEINNLKINRNKTLKTKLAFLEQNGYRKDQKIISYIPTYWGDSSAYNTGLAIASSIPEEYYLLIRTHPQTKKSLLRKYQKIASKKSNVLFVPEQISTTPSLSLKETLALSSVIIGDISSLMLEAILLDIPLVFAYGGNRHRQSEKNYSQIEELVAGCKNIELDTAKNNGKILEQALAEGINGDVWRRAKRNSFYSSEGKSVENIYNSVISAYENYLKMKKR